MACGVLLLLLMVAGALAVAWVARALRRPGGPSSLDLVNASLFGGLLAAAVWTAGVALLLLITRAGNAGLWFVFAPVAGLLGAAVGVGLRMRRPRS